MMLRRLLVSLHLTLALIIGTLPAVAQGTDDGSDFPSDQAERLDKVQSQSHALHRQLFAARLRLDEDEVRRLTKELKELQSEEVELLRASGQLPR
jgi:hypothetical protein